ncbi:hypothetical protein EDC04DRAFT_2896706 [Pisolithus marmoratus]|nr:hypothetical protein EDC04DRAFT_2896706 [Pisolithus marmoratus]
MEQDLQEHNAHENEADGYLVGDIPDALGADDGTTQEDLRWAISYEHIETTTMVQNFHKSLKHEVALSKLRTIFETGASQKAISRLMRRQSIKVDDMFLHDHDDANLAWRAMDHHLDLVILVTEAVGLHAILPTVDSDPTYTFKLDLHHPQRQWRAKHVDLGFDPSGRMMYLGTHYQEEVWMAMVPRSFVAVRQWGIDNRRDNMAHIEAVTTAVTPNQFCMMVSFLAKQLQSIGFKDIYMREEYPRILSQAHIGHEAEEKIVHEMRLIDVQKLHRKIAQEYYRFVANAPDEWKECRFLEDNAPVTISVRYGQNQGICQRGDSEVEAEHWQRLHRYARVRTLTVALATHIQCVPVAEWGNVDVEEIIREHQHGIFDSPDPERREMIDLHHHDLLDERNMEVNVYDVNGFRIPRRIAYRDDGVRTAGMLFKLRDLHLLFETHDIGDEDGFDAERAPTPHYLYPIACLRTFGQFQAHGIMSCFFPHLRRINDKLSGSDQDGDSGDEEDRAVSLAMYGSRQIIEPVFSQGYNVYVHRVRAQSRFHDVQRGMITAAFAGTHVSGGPDATRARRLQELCKISLPFDRYHEKIINADVDQSLRLENVYTIDVFRLPIEDRNGRAIYQKIIKPLTRMWAHPTILETVKRNVVIFKQDILPQVVEWTTYGVCEALRHLWEKHKWHIEAKSQVPPYIVEITAALERALNFAHTGNARVLSKGLMDPLWLSLSSMLDGLPCVSPLMVIQTFNPMAISVRKSDWPISSKSGYPEIASRRSFTFNYGHDHLNAYHAIFHIQLATRKIPVDFYPEVSDHPSRLSLYIFHLSFRVYEEDVRSMVRDQVMISAGEVDDDDDPHAATVRTERLTALEAWLSLKSKHFGYTQSAHTNLVRTITVNPDDLIHGLPMSTLSPKSPMWFAKQLVAAAASPTTKAPFINGGGAHAVMRVAVHEVGKCLDGGQCDLEQLICQTIVTVITQRGIMHVPWARNAISGRGRPPTRVVHNVWVNLGGRPETSGMALTNIAGPSQRRGNDAAQSTIRAALTDCRAPWTASTMRIQDLHQIINRTILPDDWRLSDASSATDAGYVRDTYVWVRNRYNGSNPVHQTAILLSIIFCAMLPNINHGDPPRNNTSLQSTDAFTKSVRASPWLSPGKRKGLSARPPFITMMSTFIIAMYEPDSPLRTHIQSNNGALGQPWTKKHGAKMINPFNLVRLGVAYAHGVSIYNSPKFLAAWSLLSTSEMKMYHSNLIRRLKDLPYGPHSALVSIFGETIADTLGRENQVQGRGLTRRREDDVDDVSECPSKRINYAA